MKTYTTISIVVAAVFTNFFLLNKALATQHHDTIAKTTSMSKSVEQTSSVKEKEAQPSPTPIQTVKTTTKQNHPEKKSANSQAVQTPQTASTTAATTVISKNFSSWSSNGKDITPHNVVTQLQNPNIKNTQEAATLGAIADVTNGMTTWNPSSLSAINKNLVTYGVSNAFPNASYNKEQVLTESGFTVTVKPVKGSDPTTYVTKVTFTQAQLDYNMNNPNSAMHKHYSNALQNLHASIQPNGKYNLGYSTSSPLSSNTLLTQGPVGDCYFVSAVNGVLQTNPSAIQNMITPDKHHSDWYWVKFPGDELPILVKLTPAEIAATSSVQGGGVWLAVLSHGEAQYRETHGGNVKTDLKNKSEGSLDMLHGGTEEQTFPLLNGKPYNIVKLNSESSTNLANGFQKMVAGESPMPNNPGYYPINPPVGIATSGHALLIIGYNPTTQSFIVKNPWGSTGFYNPPSMGYQVNQPKNSPTTGSWLPMTNGVFTLTLAQVYSNEFVGITVPASVTSDFQ